MSGIADSTRGEVRQRERELVFNLLKVPLQGLFGALTSALEQNLLQHEAYRFLFLRVFQTYQIRWATVKWVRKARTQRIPSMH